jgi:hypothetical protein
MRCSFEVAHLKNNRFNRVLLQVMLLPQEKCAAAQNYSDPKDKDANWSSIPHTGNHDMACWI